jgi:prevent-host-death family protein
MPTVGAYEAKTHLPRLLEQVERGDTIIITKHGRAASLATLDSKLSTAGRAAGVQLLIDN